MRTLKFQTKFIDVIVSLYQEEPSDEYIKTMVNTEISRPSQSDRSVVATTILKELDYANGIFSRLMMFPMGFPTERFMDSVLDIVVLWIVSKKKTSIEEIRFTLSDDLVIMAFQKEFESRFKPWPPIIPEWEKRRHRPPIGFEA